MDRNTSQNNILINIHYYDIIIYYGVILRNILNKVSIIKFFILNETFIIFYMYKTITKKK